MSSRAIKKILKSQGYDDLQANIDRINASVQKKQFEHYEEQDEIAVKDLNPVSHAENLDSVSDIPKIKKKKKKAAKIPTNPFLLLQEEEQIPKKKKKPENSKNQLLGSQENSPDAILDENAIKPSDQKPQAINNAKQKSNKKSKSQKNGKSKKVNQMTLQDLESQLSLLNLQSDPTLENGSAFKPSTSVEAIRKEELSKSLLSSDIRRMNAEQEIKKMLGSEFNKVAKDTKQSRMYRLHPGLERKRYIFAKPGFTWPPMNRDNGLSIVPIDLNNKDWSDVKDRSLKTHDLGTWFTAEYSKRYKETQIEFSICLNTHDPYVIAGIMNQHPYHVDTLLQHALSLEQSGGTVEEVEEYIEILSAFTNFFLPSHLLNLEKALFAIESSFGPGFSLSSGMCRMDYRRSQNRSIFISLFRQINLLAKRGCWHTAFEINKALLSLDPSTDPLCAALCLDYFAIKAGKFNYVEEFFVDYPWSTTKLPNWMYSRATSKFSVELNDYKKNSFKSPTDYNLDLSLHTQSLDLLTKAILCFPSVIPKLLSKASISYGPEIEDLIFFKPILSIDQESYTHMELLCSLFVERNFSLYRSREASHWIKAGIDSALQRYYEARSLIVDFDFKKTVAFDTTDPDLKMGFELSQNYCTYIIPYTLSRHIIASDFKSLSSKLPPEIVKNHSFDYDPLPPSDDINIVNEFLNNQEGTNLSRQFRSSDIDGILDDLDNTNFDDGLMERVLRRILPWIRREAPGADLRDFIDNIGSSESDNDLEPFGDADNMATIFNLDGSLDVDPNQDLHYSTSLENQDFDPSSTSSFPEDGQNTAPVIWEFQSVNDEDSSRNSQNESGGNRLINMLRQSLNPLRQAAISIFSNQIPEDSFERSSNLEPLSNTEISNLNNQNIDHNRSQNSAASSSNDSTSNQASNQNYPLNDDFDNGEEDDNHEDVFENCPEY
ncbi:Transcription factor 25 [Smittium mucronatum]|uniref:Transcription factor 25 n=1 Tax=Smittium mucronatum TaxID=133383 RepID=A0A1R0H5N9_9FUNG|nr:Transcription factor 25 [Smittium mucronatum]